jgi:thioredoxin-like negative regulator of GroEL
MDQTIIATRINAEDNKNVAKFFDIQGYPSLILFVNGDPIFYSGEMTYEAVFEWVYTSSTREPAEITTDEGFEQLSQNFG